METFYYVKRIDIVFQSGRIMWLSSRKMFKKKKKGGRKRERKEEQVRIFLSRYLEQMQLNSSFEQKIASFFASILHVKPIAFAYIYIIDQKSEITFLDCLLI